MADILNAAEAFLAKKLKAYASRQVQYRRGADSIPLMVTIGQALLKTTNEFGDLQMTHTDRDYLFTAADLVINGVLTTPEKGDVIADATSGTTELYEALSLPGEKPWRYCNGQNIRIRLHVKRIGTE